MPNATGFLSRIRRQPASVVNAPTPQAVVNAKNNAKTAVLSNALKNYVKSIRTLRNANPFGLTRNVLINSTATNRNKINRAIANYVMNVNKAKYLNTVARQAIPIAQTGAIPETVVAPVVKAAAQQNNQTAQAAQQVQRQARGSSLLRQAASAQTQRPATSPNLEKTVKAPNGRTIVVIRANKSARWNFKNDENKSKYNLRNRNKNEPVVYEVNVNSGNTFKQANEGAVQTPRALGGFAAPTLPQTAANQAAITGSLNAANKILALSNENLQATSVNNLRANMNSLKSNVSRFRPGFSNEGANTVSKAVRRLASEINRRG